MYPLQFLVFIFIFHPIVSEFNDLKPILRELSLPRNLQEGKTVQIYCHLDNPTNIVVNFEWHFNGVKLDPTNNIQISAKEDISTLKIRNLTLFDIGSYGCSASNQFGSDEQQVNILFNVKPRWSAEPNNILRSKSLGEEIQVNCSMVGIPKPTIYWSKIDVNTGAIEQRFDSSILRIKVDNKSEGKYKCLGKNELGSLEKTVSISYYRK